MLYPNNIKKSYSKQNISHGNRGMDLESELNITNNYYKEKDLALIYKKPTPIGIVDVSYKNQKKIIEKAYFKEQSTLDYNGIYKGKYIDFDAKVTKNKTAFPLANIHKHQTEHIRGVIRHKGIAFLIIRMNNITYFLKGEDYLFYIDNNKENQLIIIILRKKDMLLKKVIYHHLII